jgi:hypothetical protein
MNLIIFARVLSLSLVDANLTGVRESQIRGAEK